MPYQRPTLKTLFAQASADVAGATDNFVLLRTSPLRIFAKAVAGLVDGVYGYLDWIARMAIPATARGEFLRAWAALVGITQKPAAAASGTVQFTGTPGAILPNGTRIVRAADGLALVSTALGTVAADGTVTVPVVAAEAGAAANTLVGAGLIIASAVVGVNATGIAATAIASGADPEGEDDLRDRMLQRYQEPPQGGADTDYVSWALAVPGVTRAWVTPNGAGAGTVVIYTMFDDAQAAAGGFPQGTDGGAALESRTTLATGDQLTVANAIYPLRPATALVYSVAPRPFPIAFTIRDLQGDSAALRLAITEALAGMLQRRGAPGGTLYPSDSTAGIGDAEGIGHYTLAAPVAPVTAPAGYLPTLGTITWS